MKTRSNGVSAKIRTLAVKREKRGVRRVDLAKKLGVTYHTLWRWETGKNIPAYGAVLDIWERALRRPYKKSKSTHKKG
jgi:transcriptional regulator with XRE-family HTH domain